MYPSRSHALVLKIHSLLGNPFVALTLLFRGGGGGAILSNLLFSTIVQPAAWPDKN